MFFTVPTIRSTNPKLCGCPDVLNLGQQPNRSNSSWFNLPVKLVALSLEIVVEMPVFIHSCSKESQTHLAVSARKENAAGQRVALSTNIKQ